MKVLMLNGSPKANGNTNAALLEVGRTLENEGISYEIFQMGGKPVRDCIGCGQCSEKGCAFNDDDVNEFIAKAKEAICVRYAGILCSPERTYTVIP